MEPPIDLHVEKNSTDYAESNQSYGRHDSLHEHRVIFIKEECPHQMIMKSANIEGEFGSKIIDNIADDRGGEQTKTPLLRVPVADSGSMVSCIVAPGNVQQFISSGYLPTHQALCPADDCFAGATITATENNCIDPLTTNTGCEPPFSEENEQETMQDTTAIIVSNSSSRHLQENCYNGSEETIRIESEIPEPDHAEEDANRESMLCEVDESDSGSEEEPLILKMRKVDATRREEKRHWKTLRKHKKYKRTFFKNKCWSSSDEESLANIAVKPEVRIHLQNNYSDDLEKCCSKACNCNINLKSQKAAHELFKELEEMGQGERYLASCLELTESAPCSEAASKLPVNSMSAEIANESNGNQVISNEIEEAIRESLREQQMKKDDSSHDENQNAAEDSQKSWAYFIVIEGKRRSVCCNFLLATLSVDENRIDALKRSILSHEPVDRLPIEKLVDSSKEIWEVVNRHLSSLSTEPVPYCSATPAHAYLIEDIDCSTLYEMFRSYHSIAFGVIPLISFAAYRRYVQSDGNLTFSRGKDYKPVCSDVLESQTCHCNSEDSDADDDVVLAKRRTCLHCRNDRRKRKRKNLDQYVVSSDEVKSYYKYKKKKSKRKEVKKPAAKAKGKNAKSNGKEKGKKGRKKLSRKRKTVGSAPSKTKKQGQVANAKKRGDVFSLMHAHLKTMSSTVLKNCKSSPYHRFLDAKAVSAQGLYEEYRKYFLNATNSELGLRFAIYESLLLRNSTFAIVDLDGLKNCPRCCGATQSTDEPTIANEGENI